MRLWRAWSWRFSPSTCRRRNRNSPCRGQSLDIPVGDTPREKLAGGRPGQFCRGRVAEKGEGSRNRIMPRAGRPGLLGELFAACVDRDRQMQVARRRQGEEPLQVNLARGRIEQVRPPDYVGDTLVRIVHDDRELV